MAHEKSDSPIALIDADGLNAFIFCTYTLLLLPSRAPELNPVENLWQFLRQTYLSNRVFETHDEILDAACDAWNALIDQFCFRLFVLPKLHAY